MIISHLMISLTDSAVKQLQVLVTEKEEFSKGLRIFVESGGCAGMQYGMALDDVKEGDQIVERDGVRVMIDPESAGYLDGATIDYSDGLAGSGFRINNPNAVRSCGCGTSFETAEAGEPAAQGNA